MEHPLRTLGYIADIGDVLVLIAKRKVDIFVATASKLNFSGSGKWSTDGVIVWKASTACHMSCTTVTRGRNDELCAWPGLSASFSNISSTKWDSGSAWERGFSWNCRNVSRWFGPLFKGIIELATQWSLCLAWKCKRSLDWETARWTLGRRFGWIGLGEYFTNCYIRFVPYLHFVVYFSFSKYSTLITGWKKRKTEHWRSDNEYKWNQSRRFASQHRAHR